MRGLDNLHAEEESNSRGVSPVIGVILMVAITVILAAVIATFVLGLGEQVSDTSPTASWSSSQGDNITNDTTDVVVEFRHTGGTSIDEDNLDISLDVSNGDIEAVNATAETVSAGETVRMFVNASDLDSDDIIVEEGEEADLIWESDGTSSTLTTHVFSQPLGIDEA